MKSEEALFDVVTSHSESSELLQEGYFTLVEEGQTAEKCHCYLYDKCIIIKAKVIFLPLSEDPKSKFSSSSSPSILSLNFSEKKMKKRSLENLMGSSLKSSKSGLL